MTIAEKLGYALQVICRRGCYASYPIASLNAWLLPPARVGQLKIFKDYSGNLIGYMTWALLSEEVERRWLREDSTLWHISEWNEGTRLWIVDFVSLHGRTRACLEQAMETLNQYPEARYLRRASDGTSRTISRWYRHSDRVRMERIALTALRV